MVGRSRPAHQDPTCTTWRLKIRNLLGSWSPFDAHSARDLRDQAGGNALRQLDEGSSPLPSFAQAFKGLVDGDTCQQGAMARVSVSQLEGTSAV
jgi:hypothetical protein